MGKVLGREELASVLERLRSQGRKVVFTNGCFDMIHAGHVRYLRAARALGDLLVIGLNTDASVSRLKPGRPVNPESARAEVLSALADVDFVTSFDEDTPYELIKTLSPDVLVKGGDWSREDIVGSDLVPDTRSLPFEEGFSTSEIIERIRVMDPPRDWVEGFTTYDTMEAGMVRDLLESGGIEVRSVSLKVGPYPVNVGKMGEIRLYVREHDRQKALDLISSSG